MIAVKQIAGAWRATIAPFDHGHGRWRARRLRAPGARSMPDAFADVLRLTLDFAEIFPVAEEVAPPGRLPAVDLN
jgi:hypothetical protein